MEWGFIDKGITYLWAIAFIYFVIIKDSDLAKDIGSLIRRKIK